MTVFIIVIVLIIIAIASAIKKDEEIKSNDRAQLQKIYEEKLKKRLTTLYIYCGILALGILLYCFGDLNEDVTVSTWLFGDYTRSAWTATHYFAFFCTLIGALGGIISGIKAYNVNQYVVEYRTMSESEYARKKQEIIDNEKALESVPVAKQEEQPGLLSIFETPPPCPRCGSGDTKTSDNYKVKQGAKALGGIAFGLLLGQNPNMTYSQSYIMKRNYRQSIKIDMEFQCKCCGYVWKPDPNAVRSKQNAQKKSAIISATPTQTISVKIKPEQMSTKKEIPGNSVSEDVLPTSKTLKEQVQDLRDLKDSGALTQEEFDAEMNKLLLS